MIMNASKKRSIQGRVAREILVNGIPGSRIEALKRDGVITLGGCTMDQARKDLMIMETGQNLCIPSISRSRYDKNVSLFCPSSGIKPIPLPVRSGLSFVGVRTVSLCLRGSHIKCRSGVGLLMVLLRRGVQIRNYLPHLDFVTFTSLINDVNFTCTFSSSPIK